MPVAADIFSRSSSNKNGKIPGIQVLRHIASILIGINCLTKKKQKKTNRNENYFL